MDQHQTSREPSNKEILIEKKKTRHIGVFSFINITRITQYIEIKRDIAKKNKTKTKQNKNRQTISIKTIK